VRIVVYDANVLYPNTLRDLLIRIAQAGLVQAKWTNEILDEVFRNITANRPDIDPTRLTRTRQLMNAAVRDCLVTGYHDLIPAVDLPDPDDRHVLAAAIHEHAQAIVTNNTRDFPTAKLAPWGIEAISADAFVYDLIDQHPNIVWGCIQQIADAWRNPPGTPADILDRLHGNGLVRAVAAIRA
jgi:predicted nucleic acid-binding protein